MQASKEIFTFPLDSKEDGRDILCCNELLMARRRAWMPRDLQKSWLEQPYKPPNCTSGLCLNTA